MTEWWRPGRKGGELALCRLICTTLVPVACLSWAAPSTAAKTSDDAVFDRAVSAYRAKDFPKAFKLWLPLAKRGDRFAQRNIAMMYEDAKGVPRDLEKAHGWYRKAAKQGLGRVAYRLMVKYHDNVGRIQYDASNPVIRAFLGLQISCTPVDPQHPDRPRQTVSMLDAMQLLASDVVGSGVLNFYQIRADQPDQLLVVEDTVYGMYPDPNGKDFVRKPLYPRPLTFLYAIEPSGFEPRGAYMDTSHGVARLPRYDSSGPLERLEQRWDAFCYSKDRYYQPLVDQKK